MRNVALALGLASALILAACGKKEAAPAAEPTPPPAMETPAAPEAAPTEAAPAPEAAPAEAAPAEAPPAQ